MAPPPPPMMAPPAPPPPPGAAGASRGKKEGLKPLVWTKVPKNRLKGTVWAEVKAAGDEFEIDADAFKALFLAKPPPMVAGKSTPKLARGQSSTQAAGGTTTLLDPKRANNIAIVLSRFKMPFDEIREAVLALDSTTLSAEGVQSLLKCVPSAEELELVTSSEIEPAQLGMAERFVAVVGALPRLRERLEAMAFMQRFNSALHALYSDAKAVTDACDLLRSSAPLRRLLGLVLQLGNALNAGSFRSGAEGFRTDCLVRIAELRTNGASSSLLQFALATLDAKMSAEAAELSSEAGWEAPMARTTAFVGELGAVRAAAKVSIDELAVEVGRLTKGLDSIRGELAHFEKEAAKTADDGERVGERFAAVMAPFAESAAQQLEELRRAEAAMVEAVDGARTYFAEEAKVTTDEFFSRLSTFVTHLETAAANEVQDLKKQEHAARSTKRRRGGSVKEQAGTPKGPLGIGGMAAAAAMAAAARRG